MTARPGSRVHGFLKVTTRPDGTPHSIPLIIVNGSEDGPVLCVDSASHATEVEGTLGIFKVAGMLDPRRLRGAFIGVPVLNTPALEVKQVDEGNPSYEHLQNMSRSFPGDRDGTLTERIVYAYVNEIISKASYVIHLHSGGMGIFNTERIWVEEGESRKESMELAKAMGGRWDLIIQRPHARGSIQETCEKLGVPAITPELGGASDRLPERLEVHVDSIVEAITNVMKHYGMLEGRPATTPERWQLLDGTRYQIFANNGGIAVYEPTFRLRARLKQGTPLMRIIDTAGVEVERVEAPFDGLIVGVKASPIAIVGDTLALFAKVLKTIER